MRLHADSPVDASAAKRLVRQHVAAASLGVTDRTLRNWHRKGLITPRRIEGVCGYLPEDLERLANGVKAAAGCGR